MVKKKRIKKLIKRAWYLERLKFITTQIRLRKNPRKIKELIMSPYTTISTKTNTQLIRQVPADHLILAVEAVEAPVGERTGRGTVKEIHNLNLKNLEGVIHQGT